MKLYKRSLVSLLFESSSAGSKAANAGYQNEISIIKTLSSIYRTSTSRLQAKAISDAQKEISKILSSTEQNAARSIGQNQANAIIEWIAEDPDLKKKTVLRIVWAGRGVPAHAQEDVIIEFKDGTKLYISAKLGNSKADKASPGGDGLIKALNPSAGKLVEKQRDLIDKECKPTEEKWKRFLNSYNDCFGKGYKKVSEVDRMSSSADDNAMLDQYTSWYKTLTLVDKKNYLIPGDISKLSSDINASVNNGLSTYFNQLSPSLDGIKRVIGLIMKVYYPNLVDTSGSIVSPTVAKKIVTELGKVRYITVNKSNKIVKMSDVHKKIFQFLNEYVSSADLANTLRLYSTKTRYKILAYTTGKTIVPFLKIALNSGKTKGTTKTAGGQVLIFNPNALPLGSIEMGLGDDEVVTEELMSDILAITKKDLENIGDTLSGMLELYGARNKPGKWFRSLVVEPGASVMTAKTIPILNNIRLMSEYLKAGSDEVIRAAIRNILYASNPDKIAEFARAELVSPFDLAKLKKEYNKQRGKANIKIQTSGTSPLNATETPASYNQRTGALKVLLQAIVDTHYNIPEIVEEEEEETEGLPPDIKVPPVVDDTSMPTKEQVYNKIRTLISISDWADEEISEVFGDPDMEGDMDAAEKAARDTVISDLGITLPQLYTILQESNFRYETSLLTERQKRFWGWSIKK